MLFTITLLTSLYFAFTYPLCFWISRKDPLKNNFHHFHLGLPVIVGFLALIFVIRMPTSGLLNVLAVIWMGGALLLTAYAWQKESVSVRILGILCVLGLGIAYGIQAQLISPQISVFLISVLSSLIFVGALYAMNLGHWYLNVHGLPMKHIRDATHVFWGLITMRLLWDALHIVTGRVFYQGEVIKIFQFMGKMDGFLLLIPIFFGTLLPFVSLFLVNEIIKLKNTQAATGILYVILCGVLIGDIAYKYYLIKFGIAL